MVKQQTTLKHSLIFCVGILLIFIYIFIAMEIEGLHVMIGIIALIIFCIICGCHAALDAGMDLDECNKGVVLD